MKNLLFTLMLLCVCFTQAQELEPVMVQVHYSQDQIAEFDLNQPVTNTAEFRAVVANDPCITTLALKELFFTSIKQSDLQSPNSMGYQLKLNTTEALEDDFIKLGCKKDSFLRWQILKSNNYKLLNSLKN